MNTNFILKILKLNYTYNTFLIGALDKENIIL